MTTARADIALYDAQDQLVLVCEVKSLLGKSRAWATKMRRNLLEHGFLPKAKYFLLAMPDRFYLWENAPSDLDQEEVEPTYEIDPAPLLKPYYDTLGISFETPISENSFAIIVINVFFELIRQITSHNENKDQMTWIETTDLLKAFEEGHIKTEVTPKAA